MRARGERPGGGPDSAADGGPLPVPRRRYMRRAARLAAHSPPCRLPRPRRLRCCSQPPSPCSPPAATPRRWTTIQQRRRRGRCRWGLRRRSTPRRRALARAGCACWRPSARRARCTTPPASARSSSRRASSAATACRCRSGGVRRAGACAGPSTSAADNSGRRGPRTARPQTPAAYSSPSNRTHSSYLLLHSHRVNTKIFTEIKYFRGSNIACTYISHLFQSSSAS